MYYYKNRTYHAELGVFMQVDPIGHSGGVNLYAYVGGDPVNFTDPMGLRACQKRYFYTKGRPIRDEEGNLTGWVADFSHTEEICSDPADKNSGAVQPGGRGPQGEKQRPLDILEDGEGGDEESEGLDPDTSDPHEALCRTLREQRDRWSGVGEAATGVGAATVIGSLALVAFPELASSVTGIVILTGGAMSAGSGGASVERVRYYDEQLDIEGCER